MNITWFNIISAIALLVAATPFFAWLYDEHKIDQAKLRKMKKEDAKL